MIAQIIGVKPNKVLNWINAGELEAVDVSAKHGKGRPRWRVSPEAFERFMAARSNRTATRSTPRMHKRQRGPAIHQYV